MVAVQRLRAQDSTENLRQHGTIYCGIYPGRYPEGLIELVLVLFPNVVEFPGFFSE